MSIVPRIRGYEPGDREGCLAIFEANVPAYFDPSERKAFAEYLADPRGRFAVVDEAGGAVLGCGGVMTAREGKIANLVWGMIAPAHHRRGLGRLLALERLSWIAAMERVERVVMDTSQKTVAFYLRLGFAVTNSTPGGYGPGLDRVDMELELDANTREILLAPHRSSRR
jgi:ribosomal protein S18 acetylase RimI-like enzyme